MEVHRLKAVSKVDTTKTDQAALVAEAYIAAEPDAAKKAAARKTLGDIYRSAYEFDKAIAAYKAVLEATPDNQEVMAMLGLSLVGQATLVDPPNREQMQEGLNYMAKYAETVQIAPNDPQKEFKESVVQTVKFLQEEQKLKPQGTPKGGPAKKKT